MVTYSSSSLLLSATICGPLTFFFSLYRDIILSFLYFFVLLQKKRGMKEKVIYLLLILLILASCAGNRKYDDLMKRADSIMNVNDDSAKVAIRMLDGVKSQLPEFSKAQKMRYELLRHKAMNKAYISFTSDSKMKEVVDYYDRHGSANERMLANYVLGCVYYIEICMKFHWHWSIITRRRSKLIPQPQIVIMVRFTECIARWDFCLANNIYHINCWMLLARLRSMLIWQRIH